MKCMYTSASMFCAIAKWIAKVRQNFMKTIIFIICILIFCQLRLLWLEMNHSF